MLFRISRTSICEGKPCDEAISMTTVRIDERGVDDPAKIRAYYGENTDWWYSNGRNHRVENGHIKRDFDDEAWYVEISSLDELMKFIDKYGCIVVSLSSIEIYDDYRE